MLLISFNFMWIVKFVILPLFSASSPYWFEKTMKHLDDHLVDINTKVSMKLVANRNLHWCKTVCIRNRRSDMLLLILGNHKSKASEEVQKRGNARLYFTHTVSWVKGDLYVTFKIIFLTSLTGAKNKYKSNSWLEHMTCWLFTHYLAVGWSLFNFMVLAFWFVERVKWFKARL